MMKLNLFGSVKTEAAAVVKDVKTGAAAVVKDVKTAPGMISNLCNGVKVSVKPAAGIAGGAAAAYFGVKMAIESLPKLRDAMNTKSHREIAVAAAKILAGTACAAVGVLAICKNVPHCSRS